MGSHHSDPATPNARWRDRTRCRLALLVVGVGLVAGVAFAPIAAGAGVANVGAVGGAETADDPTLVVTDVTTEPESSGTHRIALTGVPDGLAGFKLTLALEEDGVGTVTNASYPDHFGMTTDPIVSADDRRITVEAADLNDEITPGAADVTLATVDVTGVDDGETTLHVTDAQIDADGGSPVEPAFETGTLTVGTDGPSAGSGNDDAKPESGPDATDSVPGGTAGATIAAIAAVVAALLARRG
ncbi:hypothetical protein [Halopiger djelfimassiliensis]|uniref:hypothetical protein n=1 Tax=Halopiger djelfimassiliensis TaxID=1293047 RepID=UPI000677BD58|nr:hypothetical protein [Halopiger djelfimassiliensis]